MADMPSSADTVQPDLLGDSAGSGDPAQDTIESGKRLIRLSGERLSLSDRIVQHFYRLTWRTPLHAFRLRGRYPLKLLGVPEDPIPGDPVAGKALRAGHFLFRGLRLPIDEANFVGLDVQPAFAEHLLSFAWLRDLSAACPRNEAAPIAEAMVRNWLAAYDQQIQEPAWRPDIAARRIINWACYAPLILSGNDIVYRSSVLNNIARTARHLDQTADRERPGTPQLVAWTGTIAAALLLPGGEPRRMFGEAGLKKALETSVYADGGVISRSPHAQAEAIAALSMLSRIYDLRSLAVPPFIREFLAQAVPALLALTHGDGGLGNWQGSGATTRGAVQAIVRASQIRARPLRQARDWGYQRLTSGSATLLIDAAPPPVARATDAGCASTLAIEFSDAAHRIIVNCGGAALTGALIPHDLALGLRTTAAHSTLTLDDQNSTAILSDGTLGKGVTEVEIDRREIEQGSRLEVSHDGYGKRHGYVHKRMLILAAEGRELRGEDSLLPIGKKRRRENPRFAIRFHLGPQVDVSLTADAMGALLRLEGGPLWQFRCSGGALSIEESLWVDGDGRPRPTQQLVITGDAPPGGCSVGWIFRHIG